MEVGSAPYISDSFYSMRCFMVKSSLKSRVLSFLQKTSGRNTFSAAQAVNYFGTTNISATISTLRNEGYAIYLNTRRRADGSAVKVYRLGTPSMAFVDRCDARGVEVQF